MPRRWRQQDLRSAPVIAAARLRKGSANSALGAYRFVADALECAAGVVPAIK